MTTELKATWLCERASRWRDCPMGHTWVGEDPRTSQPFHNSEQAHRDALDWDSQVEPAVTPTGDGGYTVGR